MKNNKETFNLNLLKECKTEEPTNDTYCLYYMLWVRNKEKSEQGGWIWNKKLNKISNCLNVVLYVIDMKHELTDLRINNEINDLESFKEYLNYLVVKLDELNVTFEFELCKGFNEAIDVVIEHHGGDVPHFDNLIDYLLDDSYEC